MAAVRSRQRRRLLHAHRRRRHVVCRVLQTTTDPAVERSTEKVGAAGGSTVGGITSPRRRPKLARDSQRIPRSTAVIICRSTRSTDLVFGSAAQEAGTAILQVTISRDERTRSIGPRRTCRDGVLRSWSAGADTSQRVTVSRSSALIVNGAPIAQVSPGCLNHHVRILNTCSLDRHEVTLDRPHHDGNDPYAHRQPARGKHCHRVDSGDLTKRSRKSALGHSCLEPSRVKGEPRVQPSVLSCARR